MTQSITPIHQAYLENKISEYDAKFCLKQPDFEAEFPTALDPKRPLSSREITKIVLLSTLLPLGLLLLIKKVACWAMWALANFIVKTYNKNPDHTIVNRFILPAIGEENYYVTSPNMVFKKLRTPDGVDLEAMMIWKNTKEAKGFVGNNDSNLVSKNNWVIYHLPNGGTLGEVLAQGNEWVKQYNFNILFYNYRGVGNSGKTFDLKKSKISRIEPKTQKDLILDGVTAYQYLISHNVKPENICSVGYSLGGGVSTQVASIYPTAIANIKSFSSLSKAAEGFAIPKTSSKVWNFIGSGLAKFAGWIVSGILNEIDWNLNSAKIWPTLKTHKWIVSGEKDEIIYHPARLGTHLGEKGQLAQDEEIILKDHKHGNTGLSNQSCSEGATFHTKHFNAIFGTRVV